jgi:hypothetical protein
MKLQNLFTLGSGFRCDAWRAGVGGTLKKHTANGFDRQWGLPIRRVTVLTSGRGASSVCSFTSPMRAKWASMTTEAQIRWGLKELEEKEGK